MTKITMLGREFNLSPYKLGAMIAAAPFVDAQKARQAQIEARSGIVILPSDTEDERRDKLHALATHTTMGELMENLSDAVAVLHVGVARSDPSITLEMLLDDVDPTPDTMLQLIGAMNAVLRRSGMQSGEDKA